MLKIRRVHMVNAGYEEATFDGEVFDFREPERGDPAHGVLHAENGTGKTTALGLIFNIPVPKEARFLPHLVKPDYQFSDYFPRGVGVVAVEWHDPAGRHPVTVHFIVPQLKGSERQTWRRWALFRSGPELTFEDLPLKGLAGRAQTSFSGRDDVAQWLRQCEERFVDSHDFEAAATQDAWRHILERHGVDTHLMDSQLEFNRQEGGLDSFLRIPSEEEFVARFLALCLVAPDRGPDAMPEPVCAQVRTIVARMQGYDKLIAKRGLLQDLTAAFRPFADQAVAWREQRQAVAHAEMRGACVKQAAIGRAEGLEARANETELLAQGHMQRSTELKAAASRSEIEAEAARTALADLRAAAAARSRQAAIALAAEAQQGRLRLSAARDLRDILAVEAEITGYEQALMEAEKEAEEPRRRAYGAGAALGVLLDRAIESYRHAGSREEAAAIAADAERDRARAALDRMGQEMVAVQRQDASFEEKIRSAETSLAQLRNDHVLDPGESIAVAVIRLERERDEAGAAMRDAEGRAARHEAAMEAAIRASGEAEAERREALAKAEGERRRLDHAERSRDELTQGQVWRERLGASLALGPDAVVIAEERARDRAEEARHAQARADLMRQDADRIARHRVAAVDRNVDLVIGHLAESGFRSALAAASWLAEIVGDEERLRAYAGTAPAAFAGVFVQDAAELARVPALDFSGLALDRPVAILAPAEHPGTAEVLAVVPGRREAYDIAAAEALVEDLAGKIGEAQSAAETALVALNALTALKTAIEAWIAEWGGGRLEASRRRLGELEASVQAAEARAAAERQRAESERTAVGEARSSARRESERRIAAERGREAVWRWQERYGASLPEWRAQRARLADLLAALANQVTSERARADAALDRAERARVAKRDYERMIADLAAEAERIEFRAAEPAAEGPDALDEARALYRASADIFRRMREDRLGPVQGLLEAKRQDRDNRSARSRRDYGALADDRTALAADARDTALDKRLDTAREAEKHTSEAVGRAKGEAERLDSDARRQRSALARFGDPGAAAYAGFSGRDEAELGEAIAAADEARKVALLEAANADAQITEAREHVTRYQSEATRLRDRAQILPDRPAMPAVLPESLSETLAEIESAYKGLEVAVAEQRRRERALEECYDGFRRDARSHRDRALESVLVDTLIANEVEPAADDAERLQRLLTDRISTIEQEISEYEADKNRAIGEMDGLLLSAIGLFQRAVNRGLVPETVPRFGGKRILTMTFRPPSAEGEGGVVLRRNLCERVLIDYVRAGEVPQTDHAMAAALIERYARSAQLRRPEEPALGLRLLKTNDQGRIHHLPVAAFKASGGETLTSAMLLYLLVARLRSEGRASQRARIGGVLILDNPLGKASNALFLKMQLALARAMDVQLIFTTAVKDWAAVGEFPQVVKLRKESTDAATGRIFVKATHQWIGYPQAIAAAAGGSAVEEAAE